MLLIVNARRRAKHVFQGTQDNVSNNALARGPCFPSIVTVSGTRSKKRPSVMLLAINACISSLFGLHLMSGSRFRHVTVNAIHLMFNGCNIHIQLVSRRRNANAILLRKGPIGTIRRVNHTTTIAFRRTFMRRILLRKLRVSRFPSFVSRRSLIRHVIRRTIYRRRSRHSNCPTRGRCRPNTRHVTLPNFNRTKRVLRCTLCVRCTFNYFRRDFVVWFVAVYLL